VEQWGYILEGEARVDYSDGNIVTLKTGESITCRRDIILWLLEDLKVLEFSPHEEFHALMDHIQKKMAAGERSMLAFIIREIPFSAR